MKNYLTANYVIKESKKDFLDKPILVESVKSAEILLEIEESENPEEKLNEKVFATVKKEEFKKLFGENSKPRKGDAVSIEKLGKKFKIKKSKKYQAKKTGEKGYKLELKEKIEKK